MDVRMDAEGLCGKTLHEAHPYLFLVPTLCSKEACLQCLTLGCLRLVVTLENILLLTRMSGICQSMILRSVMDSLGYNIFSESPGL